MQQTHIAAQQFGAAASDYLTSAVHATGADLDDLGCRFRGQREDRVLDLGCGAGHASYAVAPEVREVVAYDVSTDMLAVVAQGSAARGLNNIRPQAGAAEALPFADREFDAVMSRLSAHHWRDLPRALREVRRVLKHVGRAIFIDSAGVDDPLLDSHLQTIEVLRDRSHVRNYAPREWRSAFQAAGFQVEECETWRIQIDFRSWIARMRTPPERVAAITHVWQSAPAEVTDYFRVQPDGSFELEVLRVVGRAA
jgi:SAM-dependent methyltransferase